MPEICCGSLMNISEFQLFREMILIEKVKLDRKAEIGMGIAAWLSLWREAGHNPMECGGRTPVAMWLLCDIEVNSGIAAAYFIWFTHTHTHTDICLLPPVNFVCPGSFVSPSQQRFYFSHENGICVEFTYFGCPGNANNFFTLEECLEACGEWAELMGGASRLGSIDTALGRSFEDGWS